MVQPTTPPANGFVAAVRRVYNPLGFRRGYNAMLFLIFGGAMLGFVLARFQFLNFDQVFCKNRGSGGAPGECYYYSMPRYRVGIVMHLACILPAGFLAVFQFVPVIRYKAILYHRIAGHVIILLVILSIVGALMIGRVAFGGTLDTQAVVGLMAIMSIVSLSLAYYNIKRKQIDQHRAWMLRAWFYMGAIITMRFVMILSAVIVSKYADGYYTVQPCAKLLYTYQNETAVYERYPQCAPDRISSTVDGQVVVKTGFGTGLDTTISALNIGFGTSGWLSLFIHAVGVEIYLRLTARESERLRNVSYQRQLERGMMNPGSAGLVPEKFGDMDPWVPAPSK